MAVRGGGLVGIPFRFALIDPDLRRQAAFEVWIAGNLLDPQNVLETQSSFVHRAIRAVQHGQTQGLILVGGSHRDELGPRPEVAAQAAQTGPAHKGWRLNNLPIPEQLPQLLLKEIYD